MFSLVFKSIILKVNFLSGVPNHVIEAIKEEIGFVVGQLPFMYLGVPLVSRNLSLKDC